MSDPNDSPERVSVRGLGRLPAFSHASVAGDLIFVSGTLGTVAAKARGVKRARFAPGWTSRAEA